MGFNSGFKGLTECWTTELSQVNGRHEHTHSSLRHPLALRSLKRTGYWRLFLWEQSGWGVKLSAQQCTVL